MIGVISPAVQAWRPGDRRSGWEAVARLAKRARRSYAALSTDPLLGCDLGMDPLGTLPPCAGQKIRAYLRLISEEQANFIQGIYVLGSLALGDYRAGRSDVDFVSLTEGPISSEQAACLARIHSSLAASGGPSLDGFYIEAARLRRVPERAEQVPFSLDGTFHAGGTCFEINPVTWACWSQHGIALRGPPARNLGIATDLDVLRRFQRENLRTYWSDWIEGCSRALARKHPGETVDAAILEWGVLGVCRIACTLATGRIVSKAAAGRWALDTFPQAWHLILQDALLARQGAITQLPLPRAVGAVEFLRHVIAEVAKPSDQASRG
jgi:Domain of unknown function (DUF4111)